MSNRFEPLFALDKNLYAEDCPVIVSAGMLLKDTESKRLAAQLKFRNVTSKTIWALTVSLACVDTGGQPTSEVFRYQYQDLTAARGEEFGSKKAILIPNNNTRGFSITEISAVFSDGTTQTCTAQLAPLPEQELLSGVLNDPQLVKQYRLATNDSAMYVPVSKFGLQLCPCGQWHSQPFCADCGLSFAQAEQAYDLPKLQEDMDVRLETENAEREEARRVAAYDKAIHDLSSGKLAQLRSAEAAFTELGDYRDSAEQIEKCRTAIKDIALEKMQNPKSPYDYAEAEKIFKSLGDVDDCKALSEQCHAKFTTSKDRQADKLKKIVKRVIIAAVVIALVVVMVPVAKDRIIPAVKYSQAEKYVESAQYDEAIAAFEALGDYKDAADRIDAVNYAKAEALLSEGSYTEASDIFKALRSYSDSADRVTECTYLYAKALIDGEQYEDAVWQLKKVGDYEDAEALLDECYQLLAEADYAAGSYANALAWYSNIGDLDTENTIYIDCVYQAALLSLADGDYKNAVYLFSQVYEYSDSADRQKEAMYAYVTENPNFNDETTMEYLEILTEAEYEDSATLLDTVNAAREAEEAGLEAAAES